MKINLLSGFGKLALLIAVVLSPLSTVISQNVAESKVPVNTVKAFKAASQGSSAVWMAGSNNSYEASWAKSGQRMVYVFDQSSQLQLKKYLAPMNSLPAGVPASVKAACPGGKVDGAYRVVNRNNQKYYEVQVQNTQTIDRMRFDLSGKPIGKSSMAAAKPVANESNSNSIAMRGEAASPSLVEDPNLEESDADIQDLLEEDSDLGDLIEDDNDTWEDIDLEEEVEDDSDLFDSNDSFEDVDLDDEDEDESDDGY